MNVNLNTTQARPDLGRLRTAGGRVVDLAWMSVKATCRTIYNDPGQRKEKTMNDWLTERRS